MGLDLVPEGCAKPGFETEWRQILQRSFDDEAQDEDQARFNEISIPPHERVGAPRVGFDPSADEWIIRASKVQTPEQEVELLEEMQGYYVLPLVECDGISKYTHAGLYDGVDETSFRGAFLDDCRDVLSRALIEKAWDHKFPEEAVAYGLELLAAADAAPREQIQEKSGLLARLGLGKKQQDSPSIEEQLDIVRSAGRWFVYWGERGHPIRAWF